MIAVQTTTSTEVRSHEEDLASYLDRLLRQKPEPLEQQLPPVIEERKAAAVQHEPTPSAPPEERPPRTWDDKPVRSPAATKQTAWPKPVAIKRPKRSALRSIRTKPRSGQNSPGGVRKIMMTALIPILAVTLFVLVRGSATAPVAAKAESSSAASKGVIVPSTVDIDWEIPPAYTRIDYDPMRIESPSSIQEAESPVAPRPMRESLEVKGVLFSEDRPMAVIGTRLVSPGDQIAGAMVIAIDRDGVEFERDGRRWRQTVSPE